MMSSPFWLNAWVNRSDKRIMCCDWIKLFVLSKIDEMILGSLVIMLLLFVDID